jgi:hypothetical protein
MLYYFLSVLVIEALNLLGAAYAHKYGTFFRFKTFGRKFVEDWYLYHWVEGFALTTSFNDMMDSLDRIDEGIHEVEIDQVIFQSLLLLMWPVIPIFFGILGIGKSIVAFCKWFVKLI